MNSMNSFGTIFFLINAIILVFAPRRWAPLPLLVGACYMTRGQGLVLMDLNFSILRMLIGIGFLRVILRNEWHSNKMHGLDMLILMMGLMLSISSLFHNDPTEVLKNRLGYVYDICGIYFLIRIFCQSLDDVFILARMIAFLLIPVALEMIYEKLFVHNLFSLIGDISPIPYMREGKIRASGPFAHAILAGTVGAACLPLVVGIWKQHRTVATVGIVACLAMVLASNSSGPLMSAFVAIWALLMWHYREHTRFIVKFAIFCYFLLMIIMTDPAYYILARIDLTGSSTGWHRARLIESSIIHINEWWIAGTDYTRHWMPTGVSWSAAHTDITNHYLKMGVLGGLPVMCLFMAALVKGFFFIGQILQQSSSLPIESQFFVWTIGSSLFVHAVTFIAVSYFDQSFIFIYLILGAIGSIWSDIVPSNSKF